MEQIPVTFEFKGKEHRGFLTKVSGAGDTWQLIVNGFFWGQLIRTELYGWQFYAQKEDMSDLSDYFGDVVMAWYQ